jgi:hypothetical protein
MNLTTESKEDLFLYSVDSITKSLFNELLNNFGIMNKIYINGLSEIIIYELYMLLLLIKNF